MLFKRNVKCTKQKNVSSWRKTSIGTWSSCSEASIYSTVEIDARPILKKLDELKATGVSLSIAALVGKGLAIAMHDYPMMNSILRFGQIYNREDISIFFQVSAGKSLEDVSGLTIRNCDTITLENLSEQMRKLSMRVKNYEDKDAKNKKLLSLLLPSLLIKYFLKLVGFILYDLNIYIPIFSMPDYFGSAMITSLGMFGIPNAYAPLLPFTRCPLIIAVGKVVKRPIVEDDQVIVAPTVQLCATLDHRLVDGYGAAKLMKALTKYLADPY